MLAVGDYTDQFKDFKSIIESNTIEEAEKHREKCKKCKKFDKKIFIIFKIKDYTDIRGGKIRYGVEMRGDK